MRNEKQLPTVSGNMYCYEDAVYQDVSSWIDDNGGLDELKKRNDYSDDIRGYLIDQMFNDDSVTGNGSGSYWFSTYKAQLALIGNMSLVGEADEEFGGISRDAWYNPESLDVIIRCYLLPGAVDAYIERHESEPDED